MWNYYFSLGLRSLRRNPVLTGLMVLILAVGIGASMTSLTMLLVLSGDPMPQKSDRLFVPKFHISDMQNYTAGDEPDSQFTYIDTINLLRDKKGKLQTALFGISPAIDSGRKDLPPFFESGMATTSNAFVMFNMPFRHGNGWTADDDAKSANVAVIGPELSEKLFKKENPVGKKIRIDDRDYTITGVLEEWKPTPKFYRVQGSDPTGRPEQLWLPFANAVSREYRNNGWNNCSGDGPGPGYEGWLKSECSWIQYWVELENASDRSAYQDYLGAYTAEQKKLGRMPRPEKPQFKNLAEWLEDTGVVNRDTKLSSWIAFAFLLVCIVNLVALMLAKFTARAGEIGVRRALGASRKEIFRQYLIEAGVIGIVGALLGLALSWYGVHILSSRLAGADDFYQMDAKMLLITVALSIVAALLAGLLPTWRACQIRPAIQLKSQ
jgi:putative ABC transport system permease protein